MCYIILPTWSLAILHVALLNLFEGWTAERVQEYFLWAYDVVEGLRGTNKALEGELDLIFKAKGINEGKGL